MRWITYLWQLITGTRPIPVGAEVEYETRTGEIRRGEIAQLMLGSSSGRRMYLVWITKRSTIILYEDEIVRVIRRKKRKKGAK